MSSTSPAPGRTVSRVTAKRRLGPDAQVDDKAIVIAPDDPARTDPFLALAEDWFSEPGFEWHPHRGLETVTIVLDGVLDSLLGETILQFEGGDRQTIDEQTQVESTARLVQAVSKLARNRKTILRVLRRCF